MLDEQQEKAVWARVRGEKPEQCIMPLPEKNKMEKPGCSLCPEQLLDGLVHIRAAAMGYRVLAECLGKNYRKQLLCLADEACANFRTLAAVYYLLTGKTACLPPQCRPYTLCPAERLRKYYQEAVEYGALFCRLASCGTPYAKQLRCLAASEERQAAAIVCLLQEMVC